MRPSGFKFLIDPCMARARRDLQKIFRRAGIPCAEIRGELNPLFPGINPEPILPHIAATRVAVVEEKCEAGLITDGDADRIGAVDEQGNVVDAHMIFCGDAELAAGAQAWPGDVTRAFNTTPMLDRIAEKHGRTLHEHGIGFKYVVDLMLTTRSDRRRGVRRGGHQPAPAGARRAAELAAAGERDGGREEDAPGAGPGLASTLPPLLDGPSVAVLPFANLSGDASQEYLSDGITEDVINGLSYFSDLAVIARSSSFSYKGRAIEVREVGQQLGVRYVVEGSVRRIGDRIRITAQLVDARSGVRRWGERFDRELGDIFAVLDEITCSIVGIVVAHLGNAEGERISRKPPELLDGLRSADAGRPVAADA